MITLLLYDTDSYLQEFEARVMAVDVPNQAVLLDRTAFYPGGGGQPHDRGVLRAADRNFPVKRVRKGPEGPWHELEIDDTNRGTEVRLPVTGEKVHCQLDWEHRYACMRTHTAMHILCGVVFRDYGAQVTGGEMEPLKGRMDFEFETLTKDLVSVIEAAVNREVELARPVTVNILPREEAFKIPDLIRTKVNLLPEGIEYVRTVEIEGLDLQADGGTHVRNTSEVGRITISDYKSKGKINKRIYVDLASS